MKTEMSCRQEEEAASSLPAHVLILPVPLQGHINSMLKLAELLCLSDLHVTMIFSEYAHSRLRRHADIDARFSRYPGFRVATMPDGLPADHPRVGESVMEIVTSLLETGGAELGKLMESTDSLSEGGARRRVNCLIMDGILSFAVPVAQKMQIPFIYFRTSSPGCSWANFCLEDIIQAGDIPLRGVDEDKDAYLKKPEMDFMVTSVPGMEHYLRRRDLPAYCRVTDVEDPGLQTFRKTRGSTDTGGIIFNTFEDLDGPILDQIRTQIPNLYSIGPLHTHLQSQLQSRNIESSSLSSSSLWEEDRTCITWLNSQTEKSVIYVSFGSVTLLTRKELLEFWYGLVNSGHKFLWVMRPDSIIGNDDNDVVPADLEEGTKERGCVVGWVPQNEVLAHSAVGAFFTHSGWNSTLESVVAGVPMLCWPYFADQTINSRFVEAVWKVGLDMKDRYDRETVEKKVREIMGEKRVEFEERGRRLANLANKAIGEGGTSHTNLNKLVDFIKSSV